MGKETTKESELAGQILNQELSFSFKKQPCFSLRAEDERKDNNDKHDFSNV